RLAAVLEALVPREDTRQQARLAQDLKSVAGAEDQSAASDELAQRLDDRRATGHRARAQVVTVREAARQDHAVELTQVALAMPRTARADGALRRPRSGSRSRSTFPGRRRHRISWRTHLNVRPHAGQGQSRSRS